MTISMKKVGASVQVKQPVRSAEVKQSTTPNRTRGFGDEMSTGRGGALRRAAASLLGGGVSVSAPLMPRRAGGGGKPWDPQSEFGHVYEATSQQFGNDVALQLKATVEQVLAGQLTPTAQLPAPGDVLVYAPNSGSMDPDLSNVLGGADELGHVAVVQDVRYETEGGNVTVVVTVSERNWNSDDPNETTTREVRFEVQPDGSLRMPDGSPVPEGIGFVAVNPERPEPPPPPIGPADVPPHGPWVMDSVSMDVSTPFTGCMRYLVALGFGPQLTQMAGNQTLNAGSLPKEDLVPQEGQWMVWEAGAADGTGFTGGPMGHVAYVEDVTANYQDGVIVSYTITVSEGNEGAANPNLRTFTVPADSDGTVALPPTVGFFQPRPPVAGSAASSVQTSAPPSPTSASPTAGQPYTVQDGDTLWSIAVAAGVDFIELQNSVPNPNNLSIGQVIDIPAK